MITPLSQGTVIGDYTIQSIHEQGENFVLYQVQSSTGQIRFLREFCPHEAAIRDELSGKVNVLPGYEDIYRAALEHFNEQFESQAELRIEGLGTVCLLDLALPPIVVPHARELHVAEPIEAAVKTATAKSGAKAIRRPLAIAPPGGKRTPKSEVGKSFIPGKPTKKPIKQSSGFAGIIIVLLILAGVVCFLLYQSQQEKPQPSVAQKTQQTAIEKPKEEQKQTPVDKQKAEISEPSVEPKVVEEIIPNSPDAEVTPELGTSTDILAYEQKLREEALASQGHLSAALLKKYPVYAEAYIRDYVKQRGKEFSADFEQWLKTTKANREVFAMFYPPDPNVTTNVAYLIDELGLGTAEKYHQLVLAFAIGRREFGMGAFDLTHQGRFNDGMHKLNNLRESGIMPAPADLYCAGKPPINWYGPNPQVLDEELYLKVAEYLDKNQLTPKQAWEKKYTVVSDIGQSEITEKNIADFLHEYMYRHNQLRRKRDPFPTPVEFFVYLVDKFENYSKLRDVDRKRVEWKGVSLTDTPWPAMLALSETRPLRECDSVWERYLGQRGPTREWLYGPYRSDSDKQPPIWFSFDPDPEWARESNERKLHEGGVCGTMSLISRNSQIARGIPAAPAGQPGHGNLMVTNFDGNGCRLRVGQSVDTLKATTGFWYLRDSKANRTGHAEYQTGLALSMNIDYEKFIASRFGMNLFKLSQTEQTDNESSITRDFTRTVMRGILNDNPFYTEAWYTLFDVYPADLLSTAKMVDEIRHLLPDNMGLRKLWKTRKYSPSVGRGDRKQAREILQHDTQEYVNVLCSVLLENALKQEHNYKAPQWTEIMNWLKTESKKNSYPEPQAAYQLAYVNAQGQGADRLQRTVERGFKKACNFYRNKNNILKEPDGVEQDEMAFALDALCMSKPAKELLPWLKAMIDACPNGFKYAPKNANETKIRQFYESLSRNYMTLADEEEQSRVRDSMLAASDEILKFSNDKKEKDEERSSRRHSRD